MTSLREAAQQALEALEISHPDHRDKQLKAITALKAALAEPEHEIIQRMRRLRAEAQAEQQQALEQGRCSSCGQELPEELKTQYLVNHDLPIGCEHCNHPLYAAIRCRICGRDTDPMSKVADAEKKLGLDYMEEKK